MSFFHWYILFLFETRSCHVTQAQFCFSILDARVTGVPHDVPQNCSSWQYWIYWRTLIINFLFELWNFYYAESNGDMFMI